MTKDEYIAELYAIAICMVANNDGRIFRLLGDISDNRQSFHILNSMVFTRSETNHMLDDYILGGLRICDTNKLKSMYENYNHVREVFREVSKSEFLEKWENG
jgi:hypothetical protein